MCPLSPHSFKVMVNAQTNTYLITGLKPLTEYEVSLSAIYKDESESESVILVETTGNKAGQNTKQDPMQYSPLLALLLSRLV